MKEYLEGRIQELEKEWDECQSKLFHSENEEYNYYYSLLNGITKAIKELNVVLKMVNQEGGK